MPSCQAVKPRIAITSGDPAGIGPEIAARAAADRRVLDACEPVVYAPPDMTAFAPGVLSAHKRPRGPVVAATTGPAPVSVIQEAPASAFTACGASRLQTPRKSPPRIRVPAHPGLPPPEVYVIRTYTTFRYGP